MEFQRVLSLFWENSALGKYHCMVGLQFYKFGFNSFTRYIKKQDIIFSPLFKTWDQLYSYHTPTVSVLCSILWSRRCDKLILLWHFSDFEGTCNTTPKSQKLKYFVFLWTIAQMLHDCNLRLLSCTLGYFSSQNGARIVIYNHTAFIGYSPRSSCASHSMNR